MLKVSLISHTNAQPLELASHAALMCYQAETPEMGKTIDVENRLFKVGHHTTLEHFFLTFAIEGLPVGEATFGLHLAHPFYNTDQRSGRYCAKMFVEPDFRALEAYIKATWPQMAPSKRKAVLAYIKSAVGLYDKHILTATKEAEALLKKERPYLAEKAILSSAPKIAQEQVRSFIPVIFPTALDFSIDLITLVSMYESAWSETMRQVTKKMVEEVIKKFPQLKFMFDEKRVRKDNWAIVPSGIKVGKIKYRPQVKLLDILDAKQFISPESQETHPVDKLHFLPEKMNNNIGEICTQIEISLATMGQDQRHRTISRGLPKFTGAFYLPPILKKMKLEEEATKLMRAWQKVSLGLPKNLAMLLAPYGAMVSYAKRASFNAIAHEQGKRLCFCAQEEIYHMGKILRKEIEKRLGKKSSILRIFEPPCYRTGRCAEGGRFCGRDLKLRLKEDAYFPWRSV